VNIIVFILIVTSLQSHLQHNKDKYAEMLKDFYEKEEWPEIINEAGPDYQPPEGQSLGLRTVHIFALANVLRRPIILLDSITGMQSKGDYSGIFLPYLYSPEECCTQGTFNSPIVIAWSSSGYNHFIPLVPIKDTPLPKLPYHIRPKVWGVDESLLHRYTNIDQDNSITVAGGKPLQDTYLQKLVACMEQLFYKYHGVTPSLVADVNQYAYRSVGCVGVSLDTVTMETKMAVEENRLFRCLVCNGISIVPEDWLCKDGTLYAIADNEYSLQDGQNYSFPRYGITAEYKSDKDILIATEVKCFQCSQLSRRMGGDGVISYQNGDRTQTRADPTYSKCCGFKHYWDGKEYDNMPEIIQLSLTWKGRKKTVRIPWFQNEKEPSLNSNVFEVAYQVRLYRIKPLRHYFTVFPRLNVSCGFLPVPATPLT
jgi:deubiquitinating protein VCIP135